MLTELRIRNFAIIESLTLPLSPGFNALSGETGAGKSIIVGALGMLLGERSTGEVVRTGSERATVEGVFDISDRPEIASALDERGIEIEDDTVIFRREISANGRSRAWANGATVTAGTLGEVGRLLVNLHGQHEAQSLLDEDSQRATLDAFGNAAEAAARVRGAHEELLGIRRQIAELTRRKADAEKRADYLRHVAREIEDARLSAGEDVRLEEEARRLENADELRSLATGVAEALDGSDEAMLPRLASLRRPVASLQRIDPSLATIQDSLDNGHYALEELARSLAEYAASMDLDPERLEQVRQRRDLLFRLTSKYGPTLADVIETGRRSRAELDLVDSGTLDLRQLQERSATAEKELASAAAALSKLRAGAGERLASAVEAVLPDLGMVDGHFAVALVPRDEIGPTGAEDIEFRVALNVGHEARPLARVASGGELSRVMLALKTILARLDRVPTLVFDEVDAGIGGKVGLQVGDTMRRVASHHQVFAITHLPQIAARAHHHIVVTKAARGGVTTADVAVLDAEARITELARMLGGDAESEVSRAHAREMLATADSSAPSSARATRRARRKAG